MSKNGENIKHYSAADIQKYLEGELSAAEMHAMEKAAMDDPFLADAMEGMEKSLQGSEEININKDIAELQQRLEKRVADKNKIISLPANRYWWRIAAAIILIATGALTYNYFLSKPRQEKTVALAKEGTIARDTNSDNILPSHVKTDTLANADVAASKNPDSKIRGISKQIPVIKKDSTTADISKDTLNAIADISSGKTQSIDKARHNEYEIEKNKENNIPDVSRTQESPGKDNIDKKIASVAAGVQVSNKNFFTGRVIDANNKPVISAIVALRDKKTGTMTDNNGLFTLNVPKEDSIANITINSVGYQPASIILKNNNASNNVIQLQTSKTELSEVVVTGFGVKKRGHDDDDDDNPATADNLKRQKIIIEKAIPAIGWTEYKNYLNKSKKITTADSTLTGNEVVSFVVNRKGEFSSFKIEQSMSPAHDAEAIRLIKQGPAWKLRKGKKARTTVTIVF